LTKQQSFYQSTIRNTEDDPNQGKLLGYEVERNRKALNMAVDKAMVDAGIPMTAEEKAALRLIRLDFVGFETGSYTLTSQSSSQVDDLAGILSRYPEIAIEIEGHTDNTGDAAANIVLSQNRAEAIKNYLIEKGISQSRLTAIGYGSSQPVDTNDTDEGRQKNRRTQFRIISN
jgi:cytochrome c oxidase subunit 2